LIGSNRIPLVLRPGGGQKIPISFRFNPCYSFLVFIDSKAKGAINMEWVTPQHEEIDLNCEVSSYANAEL
jgi:hypothetical protein